jgi:hypothetical protein
VQKRGDRELTDELGSFELGPGKPYPKLLSFRTTAVRRIFDMNTPFGSFNLAVGSRGIRDANDNKRCEVPTAEEAVLKTIPLSSIIEFQLKSQKTVRRTGFAESAVWAVFAASSAITILLSLFQIVPPSV